MARSYTTAGAHGTVNGSEIQEYGFKISPDPTGHNMFGAGIYFYEDDDQGRMLARGWARDRAEYLGLPLAVAKVLGADMTFADDVYIDWQEEDEQQVYEMLKEWKQENPNLKLDRKLQNRCRAICLAQVMANMPNGCAVVFSNFPFPPALGKGRYPGCLVLNVAILSAPPYREEV